MNLKYFLLVFSVLDLIKMLLIPTNTTREKAFNDQGISTNNTMGNQTALKRSTTYE